MILGMFGNVVAAAESETSAWDVGLSVSTIVLAIATIALVVVGWRAARTALGDLQTSNQALSLDHKRRRGEATMTAVLRFTEAAKIHHGVLVSAARAETEERRKKDPAAQKVTIRELLRTRPNSDGAGYYAALQDWLDELEILALGARMGFYDVNVIYHVGRGVIRLLWEQSTPYVQDLRGGKFDSRAAQPSVYEHCEWLFEELKRVEGKVPTELQGSLPSPD